MAIVIGDTFRDAFSWRSHINPQSTSDEEKESHSCFFQKEIVLDQYLLTNVEEKVACKNIIRSTV